MMKYVVLCSLILGALAQYKIPQEDLEKESSYWMGNMKEEIQKFLKKPTNTKIAKNIVIFIGDGMGITVSTAGRIFKGQQNNGQSGEEGTLIWENFPNVALMKTYNLDFQVPDSAGTATAFFGGVKANYQTIGVNGAVMRDDCEAALNKDNWVSSVLEWSQKAGKDTGFVTTATVTHATPANLYAHSAQRRWECDTNTPDDDLALGCKDIARQLIEDEPGKNINVVFGGGRGALGSPIFGDEGCMRNDSRNLVEEWIKEKEEANLTATFVTNTEEFLEVDIDNTDFIMGLFGGSHLNFEIDRDNTPNGSPSLRQMTEAAMKRLQRSENGYFLMVESARIDKGMHLNLPRAALQEVVEMDDAVAAVMELVDLEDTLVIVTADHSHVMTLNGYPLRGNDILGTTLYQETIDKMPYPTLMFTNGPGFEGTFSWNGTNIVRRNLTNVDTTTKEFVSPALIGTTLNEGSETHGGEDVATYATGPMAHLFQSLHEQPYVAHVMGFAACIGPYLDDCARAP